MPLPSPCDDIEEELGLDRPAPERYFRWLGGVVRGDFGPSYAHGPSVWELVDHRILHSTLLLAFAFLLSVPAGIAVGAWTGKRPKSILRNPVRAVQVVASVPEFVTGVLLILLFAIAWDVLPSTSTFDRGEGPLTHPEVLVLPALTIGVWLFAYTLRAVRDRVRRAVGSCWQPSVPCPG